MPNTKLGVGGSATDQTKSLMEPALGNNQGCVKRFINKDVNFRALYNREQLETIKVPNKRGLLK